MKTLIAAMTMLLASCQPAYAGQLLVLQYNAQVRIVLSEQPCHIEGEKGKLAVAQRVDKQYMRGCWTREPHVKLVRVQWNFDEKTRNDPSSFSLFDAGRFYAVEIVDI